MSFCWEDLFPSRSSRTLSLSIQKDSNFYYFRSIQFMDRLVSLLMPKEELETAAQRNKHKHKSVTKIDVFIGTDSHQKIEE